MAFVRRRGNSYYLVHNVRREGKVQQLHLARLGERPRITDDVVRQVRRAHPLLELNWRRLREAATSRVELFDAGSPYLQKLVQELRALNMDLADLTPPALSFGERQRPQHELLTQLRLLRSTLDVKLRQIAQPRSAVSGRGFR
ncbi:MAG: hypothetical protein ACRD50_13890 [Candidatus Acidiferrales bacterium]